MEIVLLFIILGISILIGLPIAFAIAVTSFSFLMIIDFPQLGIVTQRMVSGIDSFPLLALPFFILAGDLMAYGTTPRLMRLANSFLGHIRGGLAVSGVASSAFFGAISGSGVATSAAVGSLYEPEMVKKGYDKGFIASIMAGAGSLGIVIPPSLAMVVYGVSSGVSIGDLLLAGLIPGLFAAGFLMLYAVWTAKKRNFPKEDKATWSERSSALKDGILPLFVPFIILGGVMSGIFTPTESAVIAVVFAFVLATFVYKEIKFKDVPQVLVKSMKSSAMIAFIIAASTPFGWIMAFKQIPIQISEFMISLTSNGVLLTFMLLGLILLLGTFMEGIVIIVIMTPIFMPILQQIGFDSIHFGVVFMLGLAVGGATPPLAVNLFVTTKIINIQVEDTFPSILQVVGVMTLALIILTFIPQLSLYIPSLLK